MVNASRWQPGHVIPALMIVALAVEAAARFLPPAGVATRGTWEAMLRYSLATDVEFGFSGTVPRPGRIGRLEHAIDPKDPRQGSFEINRHVENHHAFGN